MLVLNCRQPQNCFGLFQLFGQFWSLCRQNGLKMRLSLSTFAERMTHWHCLLYTSQMLHLHLQPTYSQQLQGYIWVGCRIRGDILLRSLETCRLMSSPCTVSETATATSPGFGAMQVAYKMPLNGRSTMLYIGWQWHSDVISMPAGFRHLLVGETLINVFPSDITLTYALLAN